MTPRYRVASPPASKPLLLWDGNCGFCELWAGRWGETYGERVDLATAQTQAARFPEIPPSAFDEGIQLIEPDGSVYSGAAAVLRTRCHGRGQRDPVLWSYDNIPGVAPVLETGYGMIARHRPFFSQLTHWLCGSGIHRPQFSISAAVFLRALAVVHCIAFASLWWQLSGLIGPGGILPAQPYLDAVAKQLGDSHWWQLPTLCWIFGAGKFLHVLCLGGIVLSVVLFLRVAQPVCMLLLWLFYLSLCGAGQVFLSYQWDALLLETGLLAVFLARWRGPSGERPEPPRFARWLLWWLLFRLMFMSGYVKLASNDATWHGLTALTYHYQTQPLPTWLAWYAHQLPVWFHKISCAVMFFIELVAPFLLFGPRRLRLGAALGLIAFQLLIALTGNYTFFNLLTIALCLLFLDDAWWARWFGLTPRPYATVATGRRATAAQPRLRRWTRQTLFIVFFAASLVVTLPGVWQVRQWPEWFAAAYRAIAVTRSINSYGLFAVMTTSRPEIIIEGSRDGHAWEAYEFKWKPGDLQRRPGFVAPYQPRLDWQLWFAALAYPRYEPWMSPFFRQLAANAPAVTRLLKKNPFEKDPPRFLRAVVYDYRFTTATERARTNAWWKRSVLDYYLQPTPVR
jgi:predicted DCC family thiol-disulfide oxidoreductase YuxK